MKLRKWLALGAVVLMARSKNRFLRRVGKVGGFLFTPRTVRMIRRRGA